MKYYYFDTFANCVVNKREKFAPPERYFEIRKSVLDSTYQDRYELSDGHLIDFAYNKEQSWLSNYDFWYEALKAHLEHHGVGHEMYKMRLDCRWYPEDDFKEILEEYYVEA